MKVLATLSIGLAGCRRQQEIEIPDEDLDGLSEREQSDLIDEYVNDWVQEKLEFGWEPLE